MLPLNDANRADGKSLQATLFPISRVLEPLLGRPHKSTLIRFITRGVRTSDGRRVKLRAWRFGTRWMTTVEAAEEFTRAVLIPNDPDAQPRTANARQRASETAAAELRSLGM